MTGNLLKWQREIVCKILLLDLLKYRLLLLIYLTTYSFNTIQVAHHTDMVQSLISFPRWIVFRCQQNAVCCLKTYLRLLLGGIQHWYPLRSAIYLQAQSS